MFTFRKEQKCSSHDPYYAPNSKTVGPKSEEKESPSGSLNNVINLFKLTIPFDTK